MAPCPTHPRILVPIIVILCPPHDRCHLSGSPLTSNVSHPNSRVVVVRSTCGPPCEQLLAAVGVGAGPSVIDVEVVFVVLVVPIVVLPIVWSLPSLPSLSCRHRHPHPVVIVIVILVPIVWSSPSSPSSSCRHHVPSGRSVDPYDSMSNRFTIILMMSSSGRATEYGVL
jgi:hypothetical protein